MIYSWEWRQCDVGVVVCANIFFFHGSLYAWKNYVFTQAWILQPVIKIYWHHANLKLYREYGEQA